MVLKDLCNPAFVWLFVTFIIYIIYFILCATRRCSVDNMGLTFLLLGIYIIIWTILIDLACKYKRDISAWFLLALAVIIGLFKIDWVGMLNKVIKSNLLDSEDAYDVYNEENLWDEDNWDSFFVPGKRVPGFPKLNMNNSHDINSYPFLLDNPLPQLPLPGPPSYGPEMRFLIQ